MAGSLNTGVSAPVSLKVIKKSIFVYQYADDGTKNVIPAATVIDQAFIDGKINEADPSKRWYPVGLYKNTTPTDQAITTESFNDGSTTVATLTPASFSGFLADADLSQIDPIKQLNCKELGVFEIDDCGRIIGYVDDGAGNCSCSSVAQYDSTVDLCPIPIQRSYPQALSVAATDTTSAKVNVLYEYDKVARVGSWQWTKSDGVNMLTVKGLVDGSAETQGVITTTTFTVNVVARTSAFGSTYQTAVQGLIVGDFVVTDSGDATPALVSATETSAGVYDIVIAAMASGDASLQITKTGFCFTPATVVVP